MASTARARRGAAAVVQEQPAVLDRGPVTEEVERALTRRPGVADRLRQAETFLAVAGSVALPLGFIAIFLAWYGASHTPYLFEQVPYLISGGLLGVALVLGGGLCYFGSWVARAAADDRRQSGELRDLLQGIRDDLAAQAVGTSAGTAAPGTNGKDPGGTSFVATASGSMLHRPDCAVVASREDLRRVSANTRGLAPCRLCNPLD